MSFATRLSKLEVICQSSDPRTMEEQRHQCWKEWFALREQGLPGTPELIKRMHDCDASLARIVKDRYDQVGFEPLPTDEREMGPL